MRQRPNRKIRPGLEPLEEKQLLSASPSTTHAVGLAHGSAARARPSAQTPSVRRAAGVVPGNDTGQTGNGAPGSSPASSSQQATHPRRRGTAGIGYLVYRVTNPTIYGKPQLIPPFQHVRVQAIKPVPGKVYNVLFVVVRNQTFKTFTASDGLTVRLPGFTGTHRVLDSAVPVLTGNEQWKPGHWMVFYVLGKQYYPLSPQVAAGFQLQAGGRSSTIVPGPSGIYLRLKYNPATFDRTLDQIVAFGQGAQLGAGPKFGIPDTILNVLVSAGSQRIDFAGHF